MRAITTALLLTSCLMAGVAQAQNKPADEPQQAYTQQPMAKDGATDNQSEYSRKQAKESKKEAKEAQAEQSTCTPQPEIPSEGDPEAPQNHVEYGGGG
jgi:hypothetical protein